MEATAQRPLQGVTVIDFGQIYAGPYCTFLMAMAGARVVKVEPLNGENMRRRGAVGGALVPFAMINSNKEFVTLNLKSDRGRALIIDMVKRADVVLENFAPGVMDRLGVGPKQLQAINPRLIYAAGSGYGWSGTYRDYPAMDLTVQAMSAIMSTTGFPDKPPVKAGPAFCDFLAGIHLYAGITTALFERERTGKGRFVEVSMLEVSYIPHASTLGLYFGSGEKSPPRTGNRHSGMAEAPYNVYPAADGWLAIICVSETHWRSLLSAIGRPELHEDPRFVSLKARVAHIEEVDEMISTVTRTMPRDELFALLTTHRVPCAPVRDIDEVVNDPHLHARGMLRHVNHPELGELVLPNSPIRYDGEVPDEIVPSKTLGADNDAVYGNWLGLDAAELAQLKADGVV